MTKNIKRFSMIALVLAVVGIAVVYFMWNKPRRTVADEKGIELTSVELVKQYQADENIANTKYLNKVMQVTGIISDMSKNQDGKTTLMLSSDDPMSSVFCTMKETPETLSNGTSVTVKGFCSGMLSDVRLRDAVVIK